MKVLSSALIALIVSAPAFASVNVSVPANTQSLIVVENSETGDAQINAELADGSVIKLADTTKAQIMSDLPITKVFESYGDLEQRNDHVTVGPSFYDNQYDGGSVEHTHREVYDVYRRRFPSSASSSVVGGSDQGSNYYRRNEGARRNDYVPVPVPAPGPYGYDGY